MTWTQSIIAHIPWFNSWLQRKPGITVGSDAENAIVFAEEANIWTTRVATEIRKGGYLTWQIEVPSPHKQEYQVVRFPASVSISVLRTGAEIASARPQELFRRTMPLRESVVSDPVVSLEGDLLTVSFRLAADSSGDARTASTSLPPA